MGLTENDSNFLPIYILFAVLFLIGVIFIVIVSGNYVKNKCCPRDNTSVADVNTPVEPLQNGRTDARNYAVLEDHLHLVDSPIHSLGGTAPTRPVTAAPPRRKPTVESCAITMEFLPEENTVIQIESTNRKITKITKTKIIIEEKMRQYGPYSIHKGHMDSTAINIFVLNINESNFENVKNEIMALDRNQDRLTPHPRFVRYLGTCFNPVKREAYVITDFVAGCFLQEMSRNPEIRSIMELTEEERVQAAADLADAVYFLHGHSKPIIHGAIGLASVMIDGETHRAKLISKDALQRIETVMKYRAQSPATEDADPYLQEKSPEIVKGTKNAGDMKSDAWSLGATIMEFLFDQNAWDMHSLTKQFSVKEYSAALGLAMEMNLEPSLSEIVRTGNPRLQFLLDCFSYNPNERPAATYVSRGLQQCVLEIQRESRSPSSQISSFVFPARRILNSARSRKFDPLLRQQIEWNVKQDAGCKKRAIMFSVRNYAGQKFKSLSVNPLNDIKDMTTMLQLGGFGLGNIYENIQSKYHFEDILKAYVDAVNKEPEDIEILFLYFAGLGVQGLPKKLAKKRRMGIFLDRVGISHDLALVTGNETLFPVAKLQTILAGLNARVKRKVLILDCRLVKKKKKTSNMMDPHSTDTSDCLCGPEPIPESEYDWNVPTIAEESLDKLTTMFTIYPICAPNVNQSVVDSHPRRKNGFLTGCLINVLRDYSRPAIEDLPRLLNDEMDVEAIRSKPYNGIECKADFIPVGNNIWMLPFLTKN